MRRGVLVALLAAALAGLLVGTAHGREGSRFRPAVTGRLGVVASESPEAAAVGRRILERGGNAIDAAVASVFALNVARPQSCGIGGGGFLVYRSARGQAAALDFRETAPAAFQPTTLVESPFLQTHPFTGHIANGVPGTVAGMDAALRRYGTISWQRAIRPAIVLARRGVVVLPSLSQSMAANAERLRLFPAAAQEYLVDGQRPYPPGSRLRQPQLARTLQTIARLGPRGFYRGSIARAIVADQRTTEAQYRDGGLMTRADLARYRARWRTPLQGRYRGDRVVAMPPPTSGGIAVIEMLNILQGFPLRAWGQGSANARHVLAEAQKLAWADRNAYVADPDFVHVPTTTLISKPFALRRRALIDPERAAPRGYSPGALAAVARRTSADEPPQASTTHLSVIDARGNAVAVTCTIEQEFGSGVVVPGRGFLLNNELTDFGDPGSANQPQGGKRPRSSISPTIVTRAGRPVLVIGGAGGARIIEGTLLGIVNTADFGLDVAHALDAERIDAPGAEPTTIEDARVSPAVQAELERRGHVLRPVGEYDARPRVQAAGVTASGRRVAASDPRGDAGSFAQRR